MEVQVLLATPLFMNNIPETVLCYIKKDDCYLLLLRNKKKNDMNEGKWMGVGGHIENNETPKEAAIREIKEETGLVVEQLNYVGVVEFVNDDYSEVMHLFTVDAFKGELIECNEGTLKWVPIKDIYNYPMWEGDKAFLPLIAKPSPFFKLKVIYKGKQLVEVINS